MAFEVKKKQEIPYEIPKRKEWCLMRERELGIGKHMQLMPTDIRIQVIKRKQKEKEIYDKIEAKRQKEIKEIEQRRKQWRKRWGMEKSLYD